MSEETSLTIFTRAAQMLAQADTIQKTKELKSMALTALEWAKRKKMGREAEQHCFSYALEAERKMGEMLAQKPPARGAGPGRGKQGTPQLPCLTDTPSLAELGLTKNESAKAQMLAEVEPDVFEELKTGKKNRSDIIREAKRKEIAGKLNSTAAIEAKKIEGVYDVIVMDPPWPGEKIERRVRPNQVLSEYPTMELEEIRALKIPCAADCHVWIWTTHKFLPEVFRIIEYQKLTYVCTFVWHKPGGFQMVGLPQYNCEFAVYCRKGSPRFIDTKAFNVCFDAPRGKHSVKPEEFYDVLRRVTAGRRLDMFNRRKIEGFDGWGQEASK